MPRLFVLVALAMPTAQDQPASGLKKTPEGDGYEHAASKSRFLLLKGWEATEPQGAIQSSFLGLRKREPAIEVTVSWSPLQVSPEEAVALETKLLATLYGQDKVSKPEPAKASGKNGFRINISDGPSRNGKEAGVVYLFENGAGADRWKIKLRATFPKTAQAEGQKAVEGLLESFKW